MKQRPMADRAVAYLTTVKDAFKDDREKYDKFLELMKNFTAERFNLVRGIEEVKELLKGYSDLILGFNVFLPKGYEIKLPLEDEQPPQKKLGVVFVKPKKLQHKTVAIFQHQIMSRAGQKMTKMDAIQYIKEVQYTFRDKREKFDKFMDIMKDYKLHRIHVGVVVTKMEEILKDHEDLILGFNKFLPKGYFYLRVKSNLKTL